MKYLDIEFPNGVLTLPEETVDGTYEEVIVKFHEGVDDLLLKEIKLWECNCPAQMVFILGKLLSQEKEEVMDLFWEFLGAIILSSWAYQIKIGDLTFSYSTEMLYLTNIVSWFEKELYKGHILSFYDEKDCEQVLWTLDPFFRDSDVEQLKENPDEKFTEYVKRLSDLWKVLLRNRDNTLIKMKVIGRAGRIVK